LDIEKPTLADKIDNAYFKGYENSPDKKVGLVKALSKKVYKPGVMAHEIGHANIHASPGIIGKIQRNLYGPTQKLNMFGGGILSPMLAYKTVGKDDDSMLSGAAKGALVGTAANAGVLIPEFEASRRGIKYMMNSSMGGKKVLGNALSMLPAFLTYGASLAGPSAITGALRAYVNKKRIEHDEKNK
jgi:Zn-dependent membrane protease YugP